MTTKDKLTFHPSQTVPAEAHTIKLHGRESGLSLRIGTFIFFGIRARIDATAPCLSIIVIGPPLVF